MIRMLKTFLMIVGALSLVSLLSGLITTIVLWTTGEDVPERTILEIDFTKGVVEYVPDDVSARMVVDSGPTTMELVEALEMAADDDRVRALVARIAPGRMGFGRIQEMRDAVARFRDSGKPAFAWADTFGEMSAGNGAYYLATAFDEIHLQPSGNVNITGLMMQGRFLKGTFDKIGLEARMDRRKEYKSALNTFTETSFTEPQEEALTAVMDSMFNGMVAGIAERRGLSESDVRDLFDRGVLSAEAARDAGLVDSLNYRDAVYDAARKIAGAGAEPLSITTYLRRGERRYAEGTAVALIHGVGMIHRGRSELNPLFGEPLMSAVRITSAFRDAIEDKSVKAILFRVDSPGGSYVGSDSIWREVQRARDAGKPVIVSMGDVAGSGGYFVAMPANRIVAHPATITGSIGVYAGKFLTSDFWEMLGISWDEIHTCPQATLWTGTQDYTPEQWALLQSTLDRIYIDFTEKAASGRDLPLEHVQEVARGRIWTGADALDLGLVDSLGGIPEAIRLLREAADLAPDAPIRLKRFPRPKKFLESILQKLGPLAGLLANEGAYPAGRHLEALEPALRELGRRVGPVQAGPLTMPAVEIR